ncbi:hypothetical protein M413DRAFT_443379 [Hebeloma cylindrosporum]|uniref:Uncharacterized protein n=1 Tax=Hebeloma cylindrosporum TaxID=76867 RepID=A0A0C2Y0N9_HEBCY|nr:hypothetical protein M413DRAFT_443379 [Hebeloma cylindrosporum h7]
MEEDGEDETPAEEEDIWGGSDEEPDEVQKELMKRTASHLLSSPNPAQLEMRILANHGGDRRFSFLRGRWKDFWSISKAKARLEKEKEAEKAAGLGVLAGYGSDDSDSDQEANDGSQGIIPEVPPAEEIPQLHEAIPETAEDAAKEARRKRLKEWTEKRRAGKNADQPQSGAVS